MTKVRFTVRIDGQIAAEHLELQHAILLAEALINKYFENVGNGIEITIKSEPLDENLQEKERTLVHGAILYWCSKCDKTWWMYLEKGLEEPGPDHKPVPFIIACPRCGGMSEDVSGLKKLDEVRALPEGVSYFSNSKNSRCGNPVYFVPNKPCDLLFFLQNLFD